MNTFDQDIGLAGHVPHERPRSSSHRGAADHKEFGYRSSQGFGSKLCSLSQSGLLKSDGDEKSSVYFPTYQMESLALCGFLGEESVCANSREKALMPPEGHNKTPGDSRRGQALNRRRLLTLS